VFATSITLHLTRSGQLIAGQAFCLYHIIYLSGEDSQEAAVISSSVECDDTPESSASVIASVSCNQSASVEEAPSQVNNENEPEDLTVGKDHTPTSAVKIESPGEDIESTGEKMLPTANVTTCIEVMSTGTSTNEVKDEVLETKSEKDLGEGDHLTENSIVKEESSSEGKNVERPERKMSSTSNSSDCKRRSESKHGSEQKHSVSRSSSHKPSSNHSSTRKSSSTPVKV